VQGSHDEAIPLREDGGDDHGRVIPRMEDVEDDPDSNNRMLLFQQVAVESRLTLLFGSICILSPIAHLARMAFST
jgi:hypothetical protein